MTKRDAVKHLIVGGIDLLEHNMPVGLSLGEAFEAAVYTADSRELDIIASNCLGLYRQSAIPATNGVYAVNAETDEAFRLRILNYFSPLRDLQESQAVKTCSHTWKRYEGFTETFEYCTICDEKRK
jgi:hypothetical protein